ncbi:aldehyde dehydrogenase family protein [Chondromyces crocatus]|uniref:aldehyde dehydrogenase (NAD(+)) n=1 Tax=Chondromyces crocatus TaxID=52 RepID=A0A0K1EQ27_CHOCO|nr:aldehyde dehydrogenase family protein [Chondromyces crocatus]AKT42718.1 aldehyde dehydrogenase [Chondromyces crocatus]
MKRIHQIYVNGRFVDPHGTETMQLVNPSTREVLGVVTLGDEHDTRDAIAAAKTAYATYDRSTLEERATYLKRLHDAVRARSRDLVEVMIEEFGGTRFFCEDIIRRAIDAFPHATEVMQSFQFVRPAGKATVHMDPLGVVGIITPWNASAAFVCSKLAMALAAGSTAVIKPSELSACQTQILTECFHAAELPPGLFNIVNGRGDVVGTELTRHPDIGKISFTGSTAVGKTIARGAAETMKRVTLELGGKSPNVLLDDADFAQAIPLAVMSAFMNSGQACLAGTRLLVPEGRLDEAKRLLVQAVSAVRVGPPGDAATQIGPLVTQKQYERVQGYIRLGIEEGAELLIGGEGPPPGLEAGYFPRPTVFTGVTNDMRIAREEIFGPVLSVLTFKDDEDAIRIANDTDYGLQAYVSGGDPERAHRVAQRLVAGRVFINGLFDEPHAPFGGFKQSGLGREFGTYGLEAYLEPKAVMAPG